MGLVKIVKINYTCRGRKYYTIPHIRLKPCKRSTHIIIISNCNYNPNPNQCSNPLQYSVINELLLIPHASL